MGLGHHSYATVAAGQPGLIATASPLMGLTNLSTSATAYQPPLMESEVERTKLSIKQKAAELTKKTRSSLKKRNVANTPNGNGNQARRKRFLPRERKKGSSDKDDLLDDDDDGELVGVTLSFPYYRITTF
jgi:hypothetical protein